MKLNRIVLMSVVFVSFLLCFCENDDPAGPSQQKAAVFMYGLLGREPHWDIADSSDFWIYARIFNHEKYNELQAELSHKGTVFPLETRHWDSDTYFTEGNLDFSFAPNEKYDFRVWDSDDSFSGRITTLPQLEITVDTLIANRISLEWTDIKADFYDVEFYSSGNFEKHFQVQNTQFSIYPDELPDTQNSRVRITVAGFKGFSPFSQSATNVTGCHGYLFGYSMDATELNLESMTFASPQASNHPPNLDKLMHSFLQQNTIVKEVTATVPIDFMLTYGYIYNSSYSSSAYNYFRGATLAAPINSITSITGSIHDSPLTVHDWGAFYFGLRNWSDLYTVYNRNDQIKLKLIINSSADSAFVANPDTFSILSHPPTDVVPTAPFTLTWRRSTNADFYLVGLAYQITGDSLAKDVLHVANDASYSVTDLPDSLLWLDIDITAINGANPMHSLRPNLKKLNGYFYSLRQCKDDLNFADESLKKAFEVKDDSVRKKCSLAKNDRIHSFMFDTFAEEYPELARHKDELLTNLRKR